MKVEHVLFPSVSFKLTDPSVGRSSSMCSHDPIFGTNKNRILKNGSCEGAFISNQNYLNHKIPSLSCLMMLNIVRWCS